MKYLHLLLSKKCTLGVQGHLEHMVQYRSDWKFINIPLKLLNINIDILGNK